MVQLSLPIMNGTYEVMLPANRKSFYSIFKKDTEELKTFIFTERMKDYEGFINLVIWVNIKLPIGTRHRYYKVRILFKFPKEHKLYPLDFKILPEDDMAYTCIILDNGHEVLRNTFDIKELMNEEDANT